jgi:hypothetical protein
MANQSLAIEDLKNQLVRDLTQCAAHIVHRGDQIATAVSLMSETVAPLGTGSDDTEVLRAAEAVAGCMLRVVQLAFECVHDAGRMLAASSVREQVEQLDTE